MSTIMLTILLSAISLVIYGQSRVPSLRFTERLHNILPPPTPGWTMTEKPIADTPEMQKAVGELLNFDDGVFVDYTNPTGTRLSVYIAYWKPGKMSHRLVAGHTPDICWVGNGWKQTHTATLTDLTVPASSQTAPLPACQDRIFTAQGTTEYVWFWHLVGTNSKDYGVAATPPWYAAFQDLAQKGLNQREEQFFIRISSNMPLDQNTPILAAILANLPFTPLRN